MSTNPTQQVRYYWKVGIMSSALVYFVGKRKFSARAYICDVRIRIRRPDGSTFDLDGGQIDYPVDCLLITHNECRISRVLWTY